MTTTTGGWIGVGINISDLSPAAQEQVARKLGQAMASKRKYHNEPVTVNGIRFDSRKEARHFRDLLALLRTGAIEDLKLQPEFTLQEAYTTPEGVRVRAIRYRADFSYKRGGELVVEDVKSRATMTREYEIKKKLMLDRFGVTIREVLG